MSGHQENESSTDAKKLADPKAQAQADLQGYRVEIDGLDNQIIGLLNKRAAVAQDVGRVKATYSQQAYAPERERQLLSRLLDSNPGPLPNGSLRMIYKEIISACLSLESPLKVSYLGPEGTFTHTATKSHFGLSAKLLPKQTISDIFDDVERGRAEFGVVPIENSTEGVVNHTLDAFMVSRLSICAEVLLQVNHHLLTVTGDMGAVSKVYSHPQALAQCRKWLEHNMAGIPLIDVSSTARAAQLASEDPTAAAVASDLAASIHGLQIAHSRVEDLQGNLTRFLVVGDREMAPTEDDRTSIMFSLKDRPGVLYDALSPFASSGINLSRIESRPSRQRAWEYLFFIDLVGHKAEDQVSVAIEKLKETCVFIRVLGSYPRGGVIEGPLP
ncbi:MAG: prephenate dehydratase [Myxococcota bacterium]|nr:prephenate dehydratase [Myxococcota bacterium]